jgi:hypothetical protein
MHPGELSGPDLDGVVADANSVGLRYVVIGGFSVIVTRAACTTASDSERTTSRAPLISG